MRRGRTLPRTAMNAVRVLTASCRVCQARIAPWDDVAAYAGSAAHRRCVAYIPRH